MRMDVAFRPRRFAGRRIALRSRSSTEILPLFFRHFFLFVQVGKALA
jgi:hypothetical protein